MMCATEAQQVIVNNDRKKKIDSEHLNHCMNEQNFSTHCVCHVNFFSCFILFLNGDWYSVIAKRKLGLIDGNGITYKLSLIFIYIFKIT